MIHLQHRETGQQIPDVRFRIREQGAWRDLTSDEIFSDRTVVMFALPGAFTPTCSSSHLPGFARQSTEIKQTGIDEIYCLSVNDWFVMNAWREAMGIGDEVKMLPDGNAEFTAAMGMLVDKRDLGFGSRSWRYSMVVRGGVIGAMFIEDFDDADDPFAVSDAPQMLEHLRGEPAIDRVAQ